MEPVACDNPRSQLRAGPAGRLVLLAALAGAAWTQVPYFEAPVLGYALDPVAGSIRPISGVPGAARFEAPMRSEVEHRRAALAPDRDYALAVEEDGVRVLTWRGGAVASRPLDGRSTRFDRVVFSPTGLSAAIVAGDAVEVWTGLPGAPALARFLEHAGAGDVLAVSDDGRAVAWASGGTVFQSGPSGAGVVAEGGLISSLAFARDSHQLAIADQERSQILLAEPQRAISVMARDLEKPSSVAFSSDGRRIVAASPATSSVAQIDVASREVSTAVCECSVETLVRTRGNAVFRLRDPAKGRTPMFDGDGDGPRIVFIAAGEESQ